MLKIISTCQESICYSTEMGVRGLLYQGIILTYNFYFVQTLFSALNHQLVKFMMYTTRSCLLFNSASQRRVIITLLIRNRWGNHHIRLCILCLFGIWKVIWNSIPEDAQYGYGRGQRDEWNAVSDGVTNLNWPEEMILKRDLKTT